MNDRFKFRIFSKVAKKFIYFDKPELCIDRENMGLLFRSESLFLGDYEDLQQCTGLKDRNGVLIYEGDIIVQPKHYPFYNYKNKEEQKHTLNETYGEILGETILNYVGIVKWIDSQWHYVYHCVNPSINAISEGIINALNDYGLAETEYMPYEIIGNVYANPELSGGKNG